MFRITNAVLKKSSGGDSNGQFDTSKYDGFEWMKNIDPKMIELIENEVGKDTLVLILFFLLFSSMEIQLI